MTQNGVFGGESMPTTRAASSGAVPLLERKTMSHAARVALFAAKSSTSLKPVNSPVVVPAALDVTSPSPLKRKPSAAAIAAKRIRNGNAVSAPAHFAVVPTPTVSTPAVVSTPAAVATPAVAQPSPLTRVTRGQTRARPQPAAVPVAAPNAAIADTPALRRASRDALLAAPDRWWPPNHKGTDLDMPQSLRWRSLPWAPEVYNKDTVRDIETYCCTCCKQLTSAARRQCPVCLRLVFEECAVIRDPNLDENWGRHAFSCCFCGDDNVRNDFRNFVENPDMDGSPRSTFDR